MIPAHWHAPQAPVTTALAGERPAQWPLGPCWATRIDHTGGQALFLSRQRPMGGSLTVVGAMVNDVRGLVDGMGDLAIGRARLEERAVRLSGPGRRAYPVPPEYVRFRIRLGEELGQQRGQELPADFRPWRRLLEGVDQDWTPDFAALEQERHRPALLEKTGALVHAAEFSDWWFAPEDAPEVDAFLREVDRILEGLPDQGRRSVTEDIAPPPDLDLLSETSVLTVVWPLAEEATRQVEGLFDEHLMRLMPREVADRYRDRLLNMAYLVGLVDQPTYSSLIATAAWGLHPDRGFPPAHHPFLRALLRKTVEHHSLGLE
ncbi:MAG: hypothetical protein HY689_01725 [Chloroflexi bacterium]|nr:hypothetical protein [Chloroflexota bacterium]